jgi:hypothetical protein
VSSACQEKHAEWAGRQAAYPCTALPTPRVQLRRPRRAGVWWWCVYVARPPALVPRPPPHPGITRGGRGRGAAGVNARPRRRGRRWPRTDRRRVLVRSSAYNSCHPPDQGPPRRARAAAQVRLSPRARIERGARPRTVAWLLLCTACTGPPRSLLLLLRARCVAGPWWPVPCVGRACKRQSVAAR